MTSILEAANTLENLAYQRENNAVVSLELGDCVAIRKVLEALSSCQETFTDAQGNVWERPTAWAYFAACRAQHWRTAQLKANGIIPRQIEADDPCHPSEDVFAPPEPADIPLVPELAPDAPAADRMIDLQLRVTNIIRKAYFSHTRNEQKAHETMMAVLEEVMRTYEQLAAAQGLPTS